VEACWQCRAELDELQKLVAGCVRYREDRAEAVPPPPQTWTDLSREFNRLDDSPAAASLFRRTAFRWVLLGAGAASLVAATLALRVIDFRIGTQPAKPQEMRPAARTSQPASPASTIARPDGVLPSVPGRASAPVKAAAPPAGVAEELRAVAALHRLGADLGEPVEVARNGKYIVVGGAGVAPELQRQIRDALLSEPNVLLRFSESAAGPAAQPPQARDAAPLKSAAPAVPNPLEAQVGGRAQLEKLSTLLLDHDEAAMTRVYALRRLAEQFPPEAERQLSPEDQRLLKDMGRQHWDALAREAMAIDSLTSPLLAPLVAPPGAIRLATSWQAAAQNLFGSARQVEALLPAWLGVTVTDRDRPAPDDLPRQLSTALAQLQLDVQQCERLLKP
jgi:hypothetical protein